MKSLSSLKEQIRRNSVALISLAVAVSSLGYNTWRNEVWSADYDELESDVGAKDRIVSAPEAVRNDTQDLLKYLD